MALRPRPIRRNARIDAHVLEALWAGEAARQNPYDAERARHNPAKGNMSKKNRRFRFNPDEVAEAQAVAQTIQVEAPATKAEVKEALKEADSVTAEDVAAVGYYAPLGSLRFSDSKAQSLYEALRDADVKFQKKIARVVEFLEPVFGAVQKVTFGKIKKDDLKKILALKLPTAGTALFLEVALGGRPLDEGAIAVAKMLRRALVAGASTFAIITGLAAAVDLALLIPSAQFLVPVAAKLTTMAALAIPAGLACGSVAALLECVIDKRMPSKEELGTVLQVTSKLAKRPAPSQAQIDLAYQAYGEQTGAMTVRKNPRRKKNNGRKNPVKRVPIEGASVGEKGYTRLVFADGGAHWIAEHTHPIYETGQRRLFTPEEITTQSEYSVPGDTGTYFDTFVYADVPEEPRERLAGSHYQRRKQLKELLNDVVQINYGARSADIGTVFVQGSLFVAEDELKAIENRLNELVDELREKAEELYTEKSDTIPNFFHNSFMEFLNNLKHEDTYFSNNVEAAIAEAVDAGVSDEVINDILSDSSYWGDLEEGSIGDFHERIDDWEINFSPSNDSDVEYIIDTAKELFEKTLPEDVAAQALDLWVIEALDPTAWTVERNGDWRASTVIEACARLRETRVVDALEALAQEYRDEAGEEEDEEEDEDEDASEAPATGQYERRPYVPPTTSDLLEHITLPHDYAVYNVSWEEFRSIGENMKICVGGHGYAERVQRGEIQIWVVRDPNGVNLFCLEVHFADPEHLNPQHFVQVKGLRNRCPGWSEKDFYAYGSEPYSPLRTRAKNPINVDTALTKRELGEAQPVPDGEVALCKALCEQVNLDPYLQPDLLCGLYAKERFEVFDAREPQYREALARAQKGLRANPHGAGRRHAKRKNPMELRWPHGTSFAVEYWHDEYADADTDGEDGDEFVYEDEYERGNPPTRPLHAPARPEPLAEGATYKALWIGGPPGQTMVKLKKKLAAQSIDVQRQVMDEKIPPMRPYDIVLFNIEHASHGDFYTAKEMAKDAGVPFILAGHSWAKTHQNLKEAGFIRRNPRR